MHTKFGWRAILVVMLMAFGAQFVIAQVGPRQEAGRGQILLVGKGLAQIRFQGLTILALSADAEAYSKDAVGEWPEADLVLVMPAHTGRYRGLAPLKGLGSSMAVIVPEQQGETTVAPAGLTRFHPLPTWATYGLSKRGQRGSTRLQLTAMPGPPGTVNVAGFMLELDDGKRSYRVYVSCEALDGQEIAGLPRRLPGADLLMLPTGREVHLLALQRAERAVGKPASLTAAGYAFTPLER